MFGGCLDIQGSLVGHGGRAQGDPEQQRDTDECYEGSFGGEQRDHRRRQDQARGTNDQRAADKIACCDGLRHDRSHDAHWQQH